VLVITRKPGEVIRIGSDVVVRIISVCGDKVRVGVEAPSDVAVHRQEVFEEITKTGDPVRSLVGRGG